MDSCPPSTRVDLQRDISAAGEAINNAVVDADPRHRIFNHWTRYVSQFQIDPYLKNRDIATGTQLLLAFAARYRTGHFGRGSQVGSQAVEKAIRAVAQTIVLAGYPDPCKRIGGRELDVPFQHLFHSYRMDDPKPRPQLAIPVSVIHSMFIDYTNQSEYMQHCHDLASVAFYYLLRVGEYTLPYSSSRRRTIQFRRQDIQLYKDNRHLSPSSTKEILLSADAATLHIDNQKNGQHGQTIHHQTTSHPSCPVRALSHIYIRIRDLSQGCDTPISLYMSHPGTGPHHITDRDIIKTVRRAVTRVGILQQGYKLDHVGSHSLRAGGAMALTLNGFDENTIKKMGCWSSNTFQQYIHEQIGALTHGMAQAMSTPIEFTNIAAGFT